MSAQVRTDAPDDGLVGSGAVAIECRGEHLYLLPERGIWWPAQQTLLVADVHIGKAATFRALGQPVPSGTTLANLQRLESLIRRLAASRLIVLGDFLHAPQARTASVFAALATWRARLPHVACAVVEGNHDRRSGHLPDELGIERVPDPLTLGPFHLSHGDRPRRVGGGYVLKGHLHPAYVLRSRAGERLRLPCFVFGDDDAVLPAFGEFTGHLNVPAGEGQRVFVVGDGHVWPVPYGKAPP